MSNHKIKKPVVLTVAGHDPSGGAGIQADIESITQAGCYAVSIITCLTTQNTSNVIESVPQHAESFEKQLDFLLEDISIDACKIGLIPESNLINIVYERLSRMSIPIVVDPIIKSGSGKSFVNDEDFKKLTTLLLPLAELITPNSQEAKKLSNTDDLATAAEALLKQGIRNVLITGTHEETNDVVNTLYKSNKEPRHYSWPRLQGTYHGSGCTLSSHITARLALGDEIEDAVEIAQTYTWNTLNNGLKLGKGQILPNRIE